MAIEFQEWGHLIRAGHTWKESAFLSIFFTLVGMHALHMCFAFLWTFVVVSPLFFGNINGRHVRRITCLKMFWQFINIIWLFIFTIVYLIGGV
jgi:cytochrome o ubiquinol oxidase subunit 3